MKTSNLRNRETSALVQVLVPSLSGGGAEDVARRWASGLGEAGYEVEIVLTHQSTDEEIPRGIRFHSLGEARGFVHVVLAFRKHLMIERPSAVISLMPFSNLVLLLAAASIPRRFRPRTVISEHTLHSRLRRVFDRNFRIQLQLARVFYRNADACVVVSHAVGAEVCALYQISADRLWIIPNPVLDEAAKANSSRRRVADLPSISIVVPARLVESKRPNLAVSAARLVMNQTGKTAVVHYFGVGPMREELEALGMELGISLKFHGWVDRWYDHVPEDGVVLLPSAVEGFGNVLIEAAAMSIPSVVSSRTLGAADACIAGLTGILTAGDCSADYADGIVAATHIEIPDIQGWLRRFTIANAVKQLESAIRPASSDVARSQF